MSGHISVTTHAREGWSKWMHLTDEGDKRIKDHVLLL